MVARGGWPADLRELSCTHVAVYMQNPYCIACFFLDQSHAHNLSMIQCTDTLAVSIILVLARRRETFE